MSLNSPWKQRCTCFAWLPMAAGCEPCCTGAPALYVGSRNLVPLKPCNRINYTVESFPEAAGVGECSQELAPPRGTGGYHTSRCSAEPGNFSHTGKFKSIPDNLLCYLIQKVLHLVFTSKEDDGCSCGESAKRLLVGVT